jgi:hypothetical protein
MFQNMKTVNLLEAQLGEQDTFMYDFLQNLRMRSVYLKTQFRAEVNYAVYKDLIYCPRNVYQFVVERLELVQQGMSKLNENRLLIYKFNKKIKDSPRAICNATEAIKDMKTGILLSLPPQLSYYMWNDAPNYHDVSFLFGIRKFRRLLVKQIVEKASLMIEDGSLRRRIGQEARHLIEESGFSTKNRKIISNFCRNR